MLLRSAHTATLQRLLAAAGRVAAATGPPGLPPRLPDDDCCSTSPCNTSVHTFRWQGSPASAANTYASTTTLTFSHGLHFWSFSRQKTAPTDNVSGYTAASEASSSGAAASLDAPASGTTSAAGLDATASSTALAAGNEASSSLGHHAMPVVTEYDAAFLDSSFPLPEDSVEIASVLGSALDALELSSVAAAKADAWMNATLAIDGLMYVHEALGLPWWASICVFNLSCRLCTFPMVIWSQKAGAKLTAMNAKLANVKRLYELAQKAKSQEEHQRLTSAAKDEYSRQTRLTGNPLTTALRMPAVMILNGFLFVSIYSGVNKLMAAQVPSLTVGGTLWFQDLTVPDPTFGLSLLCCAATMAIVQTSLSIGGEMDGVMPPEQATQMKFAKNMMRFAALMFIPAGYYVSAGTAMLWCSNSSFMVMQSLLIRNAKFRQLVGLPSMEETKRMQAAAAAAQQASSPEPAPTAPTSIPMTRLLHAPPPGRR